MYRKLSYTSVSKVRYDSFHRIIKILSAFGGIHLRRLPRCRASQEMLFKEPIIRHSYIFLNAPSPEGHKWTVDDDGSFDY